VVDAVVGVALGKQDRVGGPVRRAARQGGVDVAGPVGGVPIRRVAGQEVVQGVAVAAKQVAVAHVTAKARVHVLAVGGAVVAGQPPIQGSQEQRDHRGGGGGTAEGGLVHGILVEEGQQVIEQRAVGGGGGGRAAGGAREVTQAGRKLVVGVVAIVTRQGHLL